MGTTASGIGAALRHRRRLTATVGLLALGLVAQASLVVLAFPTQSTEPPSPELALSCFPGCMTVTIASPLNVGVLSGLGATVTQSHTIAPQGVLTDTEVVAQLDPGWIYKDVEPAKDFELGLNVITATLPSASPQLPFTYTTTMDVLEPGLRTQLIRVSRQDQFSFTLTNTVVASDGPAGFFLRYTYPAVRPIDSGPILWAWQTVQNAQFPNITETHVTGNLAGGIIRSVAPKSLCSFVISSFDCAFELLSPELAQSFTISSEALEPGLMKLALEASGGGAVFSTTLAANVQPPVTISVPIDIKPANVNPMSYGSIPVAVRSMEGFNVVDHLDQLSLFFGRTGTEDSLLFCNPSAGQSFNLICHFDVQLAGFQEGDTQGILTGRTFAGAPIRGVDAIRTVPPLVP